MCVLNRGPNVSVGTGHFCRTLLAKVKMNLLDTNLTIYLVNIYLIFQLVFNFLCVNVKVTDMKLVIFTINIPAKVLYSDQEILADLQEGDNEKKKKAIKNCFLALSLPTHDLSRAEP